MLGFTTTDVIGKGADLLLCTGCGGILEGWKKSGVWSEGIQKGLGTGPVEVYYDRNRV